ncbi:MULTISPECIES: hypothetical protein [Comamonas]|uniref:hypothetical protein n=1 Tax=Comamonas TaxID=283 RepID=UPI001040174A|nr:MULTISPECIES: hypothetical protein [Comamonas]TFF61092.1 hypothetical protein EIC84_12770 [Comamonas sp. A23]
MEDMVSSLSYNSGTENGYESRGSSSAHPLLPAARMPPRRGQARPASQGRERLWQVQLRWGDYRSGLRKAQPVLFRLDKTRNLNFKNQNMKN